jgi:lipid-A-disaccharide synthase
MQDADRTYKIFLSAAEPSGDRLCAKLITALKQTGYNIEFSGFGGQNMARAGCSILVDTTQRAAMTYNAFSHILFFFKAVKKAQKIFAAAKPDIVIVCDSPSFNFTSQKPPKTPALKLFSMSLRSYGPGRHGELKNLKISAPEALRRFCLSSRIGSISAD